MNILFIFMRDSTKRLVAASRYDTVEAAIIASREWLRLGYNVKLEVT